jgi:hypothetical protein
VVLSRSCKTVLSRAESRIQALVNPEDDGPVRVEEIGMSVAENEQDDEDREPGDA